MSYQDRIPSYVAERLSTHREWVIDIGDRVKQDAEVSYSGSRLGAIRKARKLARETSVGLEVALYASFDGARAGLPILRVSGEREQS